MWALLIFSLLLNCLLGYGIYFLFKKITSLANVIFTIEDNMPDLMAAQKLTIQAMNAALDSPFFVTTPEIATKFKTIIDAAREAREATIQIVDLMEEASRINSKTVKQLERAKNSNV